eukprot:1500781-Rhodomonas_salina.1
MQPGKCNVTVEVLVAAPYHAMPSLRDARRTTSRTTATDAPKPRYHTFKPRYRRREVTLLERSPFSSSRVLPSLLAGMKPRSSEV